MGDGARRGQALGIGVGMGVDIDIGTRQGYLLLAWTQTQNQNLGSGRRPENGNAIRGERKGYGYTKKMQSQQHEIKKRKQCQKKSTCTH